MIEPNKAMKPIDLTKRRGRVAMPDMTAPQPDIIRSGSSNTRLAHVIGRFAGQGRARRQVLRCDNYPQTADCEDRDGYRLCMVACDGGSFRVARVEITRPEDERPEISTDYVALQYGNGCDTGSDPGETERATTTCRLNHADAPARRGGLI